MKYIKILSILLLFVAIPNIHGMEVDINQEKPLELMDLPKEILLPIFQRRFEIGTLKDLRQFLLMNTKFVPLIIYYREKLSKEVYNAFISKFSHPSSREKLKQLNPKLKRLSKEHFNLGIPYLTNIDLENLLSHMFNIDAERLQTITKISTLYLFLIKLVKEADKRKLNLNIENEHGLTPLMWTTTLPNYQEIKHLQETIVQLENIDINYINKFGKTFKDMTTPQMFSHLERKRKYLNEKQENIQNF